MNRKILKIILVVQLSLFSTSAFSQIGIKGGIGISDIAFKEYGQTPYLGYEINSFEHRTPMVSYQVGAFGTVGIWKRLEFQPELLFTMQGLNYNDELLYDNIGYKIKISYLKMPLLLKYNISMKKKVHSSLIAGPYVSWKLKATRVTEVGGGKKKTDMSNVRNVDFGVEVGYSADLNIRSGKMYIDLRCSYSLINMMNRIPGYVPSYYDPSKEYARMINISLMVGYQFLHIWSKMDKQ